MGKRITKADVKEALSIMGYDPLESDIDIIEERVQDTANVMGVDAELLFHKINIYLMTEQPWIEERKKKWRKNVARKNTMAKAKKKRPKILKLGAFIKDWKEAWDDEEIDDFMHKEKLYYSVEVPDTYGNDEVLIISNFPINRKQAQMIWDKGEMGLSEVDIMTGRGLKEIIKKLEEGEWLIS